MRILLLLFLLFTALRASCPHMMGQARAKEREEERARVLQERREQRAAEGAPPGIEPASDDAAPGIIPDEHSIQTTFIHLSKTGDEKKYAGLVAAKLRDVRERLRRDVRVIVDNENIACQGMADDHFRCRDFPSAHSFHFLVIEDSSRGASVYSIDRDLNGDHAARVEAAVLDALSRHSPHQLALFASKEAEKEVGFVRELTVAELEHMQQPTKRSTQVPTLRVAPTELNAIDTQILELRSTQDLAVEDHRLTTVPSNEVFDELLQRYEHVFVLFWTNVRSSSVHAFHVFAELSKQFEKTERIQLAIVECHKVDFCVGLNYKDFYTIVAYHNGIKIATQELILDVAFYKDWIERVLAGPLIELKETEDVVNAKKGYILDGHRNAVTIGTFPSREHTAYVHFAKIADKLLGRYYLAFSIKDGAEPSIVTYRSAEKKKRSDYSGRFDPATIASFITFSTMPSVVDISAGFSSDLLFYQSLPVVVLAAPSTIDATNYNSLAASPELAHKKYIFTKIASDKFENVGVLLNPLNVEDVLQPTLIVFHKHKVHHLEFVKENTEEELLEWLKHTEEAEPDFTITYKDVHPLLYLQLEKANQVFGQQPVALVPDLSVFQNRMTKPMVHDMVHSGSGGGCPFMHGGMAGGERHEEL